MVTVIPHQECDIDHPDALPSGTASQKPTCTASGSPSPSSSPAAAAATQRNTNTSAGVPGVTRKATRQKASKYKMTDEEELIMITEIRAARAHIPEQGKTLEYMAAAAEKINENPTFRGTVNGRCLNERYKRRMAAFLSSDRKNAAASGVGGGVTDVERMLLDMHNAAEAVKEFEQAKRCELDDAEKAKLDAGRRLLAQTTGDESESDSAEVDSGEDEADRPCKLKGPKRRRLAAPQAAAAASDGGLHSFGQSLKESELAELKFKERQLEFEQKKHADLLDERQRERMIEKEKEEKRGNLELEKMKYMMEFAMKNMMSSMKEFFEKNK